MSMIPVEYLNPFFVATQRICSETIHLKVSAGKPRLLQEGERPWKLYQISAAIRLGNAVSGLVGLSFSEPVALALAAGLAQEHFVTMNDDARDALGEVANLMVGSAKKDLPGELVTISPPIIIATHKLEFPAGRPIIVIPFEVPPGRFLMQLSLTRQAAVLKAG